MVKYKESESESDGASPAPEPCFRVRVSMQQFYGAADVRARAYVCVSPRRRVRWLARRLRRLFALPRLRLLSRGHLLPPQEPLALLRPDDPVDCVPSARPRGRTGPEGPADAREVQAATVEEHQRSPSPVSPDDLTETKRRALMMLEQLCAEPAAERSADSAAEGATRPRRRRVRRRRVRPAGAAAGAEPLVLRNDLQPRAPRVVRPLPERMSASLLDPLPTEIVMG